MGDARWDVNAYASYSANSAAKTRDQIFQSAGMVPELDPSKIKFRESVDSANNPQSTPIIIGCDETGSMGATAEIIIKKGLGTIVKSLYDHKPVSDPHICCMGTGDATCDTAPYRLHSSRLLLRP